MKRILLLAGLVIGGLATLSGCYDAAEAGVMNPNDKYECFCGHVSYAPEGAAAPTHCKKPMTFVMRQPGSH
jgi:hypothetical protein